ncbi:MAG TPA: hypothetical protein VFT61_02070 [Sphingomicrobium sp.]|nr:hypothetical protein [Sphingomicrobium sp.]
MIARALLPFALAFAAPAIAGSDELAPVPAPSLLGQAYFGETAASKILFINVRNRPVRVAWVDFNGEEHEYAILAPGAQVMQPTYVANRWVAEDFDDGQPLEGFISTRSAADDSTAQIALIR